MIIDTSALLAVIFEEEEKPFFLEIFSNAPILRMAATSYVETGLRIDRMTHANMAVRLDQIIKKLAIHIEPVTHEIAYDARAALRRFGKGSGHKAQLNYGDSFSYALAKHYDEPLLFKGNDFIHTDIESAYKKP